MQPSANVNYLLFRVNAFVHNCTIVVHCLVSLAYIFADNGSMNPKIILQTYYTTSVRAKF